MILILILADAVRVSATAADEDVRTVQQKLSDQDYEVGTVDGKFGRQTADAIRQYQSDWQLLETGMITRDLIERLERKHAATKSQWTKVENQDCSVWNPQPAARETATWSGACADGKSTGSGKLVWRYFRQGRYLEGSYEGGSRDGKSHGQGVSTSADGDRYEGEWRDGSFHGRGIFVDAGGRYEGEFRDDKQNGQGTLIWADGSRYEGEYRDGSFHGRGIFVDAGGRYEGEFRDGKKNGQGTLIWADGSRYEGWWRDDKFDGIGGHFRSDGTHYSGLLRDGKYHGFGTFKWPNGNKYEGNWEDGFPQGIGKYFQASKGEEYFGMWRHGCFRDSSGWAALFMTSTDCGF